MALSPGRGQRYGEEHAPGLNSARLYNPQPAGRVPAIHPGQVCPAREEYRLAGTLDTLRDNAPALLPSGLNPLLGQLRSTAETRQERNCHAHLFIAFKSQARQAVTDGMGLFRPPVPWQSLAASRTVSAGPPWLGGILSYLTQRNRSQVVVGGQVIIAVGGAELAAMVPNSLRAAPYRRGGEAPGVPRWGRAVIIFARVRHHSTGCHPCQELERLSRFPKRLNGLVSCWALRRSGAKEPAIAYGSE
jgi:hypothetical protein